MASCVRSTVATATPCPNGAWEEQWPGPAAAASSKPIGADATARVAARGAVASKPAWEDQSRLIHGGVARPQLRPQMRQASTTVAPENGTVPQLRPTQNAEP